MLAVDELSHAYNHSTWAELNTLATDYNTVVLVADSTARIDAIVRRRDQDIPKLKNWFGQALESLNDTKMAITRFYPLTSSMQYEAYCAARFPHLRLDREDFRGLHIMTGGILQAAAGHLVMGDNSEVAIPESPAKTSPQRRILDQLKQEQDKYATNGFNPFKLVSLDVTTLIESLNQEEGIDAADVVHDMLESKLLARTPRVTNQQNSFSFNQSAVTFGSPALYLSLQVCTQTCSSRTPWRARSKKYRLFFRVCTLKSPCVKTTTRRPACPTWLWPFG
eukprot:m.110329 g.110329  ORF g.110329 m.110329 type:complete len:279 (+) comp16037_c0_seq3:1439-2275(+)